MTTRFPHPRLSCLCLFLTGVAGLGGPSAARADDPPIEVEVVRPITRDLPDSKDFTGIIEAVADVEIRPRVSGILEKVAFQDGSLVQKGDLLYQIDPRVSLAKLDQAQAEVQQAEARLALANATLELDRKLQTHARIGQEEVNTAIGERDEAEAALRGVRAGLELAKIQLDSTRITAPIAGRIGRTLQPEGSVVVADVTPLVSIVSLDPVYATFQVSEHTYLTVIRNKLQAGKVPADGQPGLSALLELVNERDFPRRGRVDFINNRINSGNGTLTMRAVFPNADHVLVPGLSARIRLLTSDPHPTLLIPSRRIGRVSSSGEPYVYVVTDEDLVSDRLIELGPLTEGDLEVVRAGLGPEDRVIISANGELRVGAPVTIRKSESD